MRHTVFKLVILSFFCLCKTDLSSQSSYYPRDNRLYHHLERLQYLTDSDFNIHLASKNLKRNEIFDAFRKTDSLSIHPKDLNLISYYLQEGTYKAHAEKLGFWKMFFYNPSHLTEHRSKDFGITINPILNFNLGQDLENDEFIFENTRGVEIYGQWDDKFYFYTALTENQAKPLSYIDPFIDRYFAIPGQGNYKDYQSKLIDGFNGFDFSNARAYLGYQMSRHTNLELGHNKHFLGNGIRSLLLSDSGHNYFYLKFHLKIWKLQYQSIFAELSSISARMNPGNALLPKKYMANHYLSFRPSKKIEIGLFESVVFSRENHFEFQYLNPLIFYRSIEHQLDSPDNVLLGLNFSWKPVHGLAFYSQVILDELRISELFSSDGWWGNKYGIQLGLKYFDIGGISQLDGQLEYNVVMPFTYSHWKPTEVVPEISISNYAHYNQPLAHPLGANFSEIIFKLRYRPKPRFLVEGRYIYTLVGRNTEENFGSDILLDNSTRVSDFGNTLHQGAESKISIFNLNLSYELFYNLNVDLSMTYRADKNVQLTDFKTGYISSGIRYNFNRLSIDY